MSFQWLDKVCKIFHDYFSNIFSLQGVWDHPNIQERLDISCLSVIIQTLAVQDNTFI